MARKTTEARAEKHARVHLRDCPGARDIEQACMECERLRAVLRSLVSCGSTSAIVKAMAMNTLEPDSGDRWLSGERQSVAEEKKR